MRITNELREYVGNCYLFRYKDVREKLDAIADRIDEAHKHAIGYVDDRDPETMAENGWFKLPKDADDEYIHIDDVMEWLDGSDEPFEVVGIGNGMLYYIDDDGIQWTRAENKCHYHAQTVEDVMAAFAIDWESAQDGEDKTAVLKEYAKRLALSGDAE